MTSIDSSPEDLAHFLPLNPTGTWANDSTFGIIHPSGCDICRRYVSHNIEAYDDHDPSFEIAVKDRDSKYTTRFLDGFREGRRTQLNHDNERLSLYQAQRDDANMLNARHVEEIRILQEKLAEAQDSLQAMQMAFDEVSMHAEVSRPAEEAPDVTALMEMQKALLASSEDQAERLSSKFLDEILFATENFTLKDVPNQRISPIDETFPTIPFASLSRQFENHSTWDDGLSDSSSSSSALSYASASASASASPSSASSSTESLQSSPTDVIDSLEALKSLMAAAHESGNAAQLKQVKSLCSIAHLTPRAQRTVLQNYLINTWRSPPSGYSPPTRHADNAPITPPVPQVPEIYVDACPGGIGFVMGNKWLAWKLIEGWQTDSRDNNWGEMVAVELGLRAIIAAGYQRTSLIIRSDNFGVVQSLTTGVSKARQQNLILKKILNLSRIFDIKLEPTWVSTKDNLADNPSRGKFAAVSLMFQTPPTLPEHLVEFVEPVLAENVA